MQDAPKNLTNDPTSDNFVRNVFNTPDGGAFVVFDKIGSGNFGKITIMNQEGENLEGFPKGICDSVLSSQFIEDAVDVGVGIFIIWRDNRLDGSSRHLWSTF